MEKGGPAGYHFSGVMLGACSCDWGCPCNFEAPPTLVGFGLAILASALA